MADQCLFSNRFAYGDVLSGPPEAAVDTAQEKNDAAGERPLGIAGPWQGSRFFFRDRKVLIQVKRTLVGA